MSFVVTAGEINRFHPHASCSTRAGYWNHVGTFNSTPEDHHSPVKTTLSSSWDCCLRCDCRVFSRCGRGQPPSGSPGCWRGSTLPGPVCSSLVQAPGVKSRASRLQSVSPGDAAAKPVFWTWAVLPLKSPALFSPTLPLLLLGCLWISRFLNRFWCFPSSSKRKEI